MSRDELELELGAPLAPMPDELADPAEGRGAIMWTLIPTLLAGAAILALGIFG